MLGCPGHHLPHEQSLDSADIMNIKEQEHHKNISDSVLISKFGVSFLFNDIDILAQTHNNYF